MTTVTYKHQPAIHQTRGAVALEGNEYIYRVSKVLWPKDVERVLQSLFVGTTLHICSGRSLLGDVRLDIDRSVSPSLIADAARIPFATQSFDTVLADPPYNGKFQWNHDLLSELSRVARQRIVFQHWFAPYDKKFRYKKNHKFCLVDLLNWPPKSYFGRMQVISVFDRLGE